jgi:hypothetical protein
LKANNLEGQGTHNKILRHYPTLRMLILVGLVGLVAVVATHLLVFIFVSKRRQMTAQALAGNV